MIVGSVGGSCLTKINKRPQKTVAVTVVALGVIAYLARTYGLPILLKRQGYFTSTTEGALIKALTCLSRQKTDAFDEDLPSLTPPPLEQSCAHLREEGKVLLEGDELSTFLAAVDSFEVHEGPQLHAKLVERSRGKRNYIQEIWERKAYLEGRYLLGSNWFGLSTAPVPLMEGGDPQLIRATYMIEGVVHFLEKIRAKSIPPFFLGIPIPVSMKQFETLFGTFRIPQLRCDALKKSEAIQDYFVVMNRGNYYQVSLSQSREKLYASLEAIRRGGFSDQPQIGFLTAAHRDVWAEKRDLLLLDEQNSLSLSLIEGAQFILCLEDEAYEGLNGMSEIALLKMSNRHFDAGMQFIIDREGKCATNNEHTGAESTAQAQLLSEVLSFEAKRLEDGKLRAPVSREIGEVRLLPFKIDREMEKAIEVAREESESKAKEYRVLTFETIFGKKALKKEAVSPDAFMQMCNLCAFFLMTGELSSVYETAMMRFFKDGRTETIGTLTHQAKKLVIGIRDGTATPKMLLDAIKAHKGATLTAMQNKGHERHFLALKVMAEEEAIPLPFSLDSGYQKLQRKRISSSQTPTDTGGGGFLPTEEDGVGISYIPREDYFLMTVTSKILNVDDFRAYHQRAMQALLALLQKRRDIAT